MPYAWQSKDDPVLLPSIRSKNLSVLGLMSPCCKFFQKTYEGSVTSQTMIDFLDEFCEKITKKTIVVLDNAPIHKSKNFTEKIKEWEKQDLIIYFIPPYSPELNLIETLWRKLKKEWIDPLDYTNKDSLFYAVNRCMANIGKGIQIKYSHFL